MLALFAFSPVWGFVSFLPSFLPRTGVTPVGATTCATRVGRRSMPLRRLRLACLGGVFGGLGLFPLPLGWVRTRCLLVLILNMNPDQKRMVLVASGVRDRRQKIEWLWFGWLGLMG